MWDEHFESLSHRCNLKMFMGTRMRAFSIGSMKFQWPSLVVVVLLSSSHSNPIFISNSPEHNHATLHWIPMEMNFQLQALFYLHSLLFRACVKSQLAQRQCNREAQHFAYFGMWASEMRKLFCRWPVECIKNIINTQSVVKMFHIFSFSSRVVDVVTVTPLIITRRREKCCEVAQSTMMRTQNEKEENFLKISHSNWMEKHKIHKKEFVIVGTRSNELEFQE